MLVKKSGLLATLRQQFVFKSKVEPSYRATRPKKWPKSGGYEVKMRITPSDENAHGYGMYDVVFGVCKSLHAYLVFANEGTRGAIYVCILHERAYRVYMSTHPDSREMHLSNSYANKAHQTRKGLGPSPMNN